MLVSTNQMEAIMKYSSSEDEIRYEAQGIEDKRNQPVGVEYLVNWTGR